MIIGGMLATNSRLTIEANYPYRGMVDQICAAWQKSGFAMDFHPPQAGYLAKVTVEQIEAKQPDA